VIRLDAVEAAPRGGARAILGPITLSIVPGERHLIIGANGAGKTTLLRVLAGFAPAVAGHIAWDGVKGRPALGDAAPEPGAGGPHGLLEAPSLWPHVAALFETPDPQFLAETVASDIAFGLEGSGLDAAAIRGRVGEAIEAYGLRGFATRDPRTLSAGEKARALLAAALAARPRCLLLDQTMAHLDPGSRRALEARLSREAEAAPFALVRTHQEAEPPFAGEHFHLLDQGLLCHAGTLTPEAVRGARHLPLPPALRASAALAAHGLWDAAPVADAAGFARRLRATRGTAGAGRAAGAPGTARAEMARGVAGSRSQGVRRQGSGREAAFACQSLRWGPGRSAPIFDGLDLEGARGEIVALVGRSGSGKSSLLRLLAGIEAPREGVAWHAAQGDAAGRSVALALEYPERQLIGRTVLEDVGMALWVDGVRREERESLAQRALAAVGLSAGRFASRIPATLSEGEKRRVALAGLIAEPAPLLLFDEPTAGLDPEGRRALRATLRALRDRERTIVLASHDLDFVHSVADRVVLLARAEDGPARVVADGVPCDVFRDEAALAEAGMPAPDVVTLEDALREVGLLSGDGVRDADDLVERLEVVRPETRSAPVRSRESNDVGAGAA
jgi:energy-coupling factor transport system ATP-binding protein